MKEDTKRIVEISGVKVEIDLQDAKVVENYKVGDNVKVLLKKYNDNYEMYHGIIVGFYNFENRPTIAIAYIETDYQGSAIKTIYLHKDSKDMEICPTIKSELFIDKDSVLQKMDKNITAKETELAELQAQRKFFLNRFGSFFKDIKEEGKKK